MQHFDAEIIRLPGTYEDTVIESSRLAIQNEWYDANPGGANTALQISAYAEIANEIYDQLRDAPKYIAAPFPMGLYLPVFIEVLLVYINVEKPPEFQSLLPVLLLIKIQLLLHLKPDSIIVKI